MKTNVNKLYSYNSTNDFLIYKQTCLRDFHIEKTEGDFIGENRVERMRKGRNRSHRQSGAFCSPNGGDSSAAGVQHPLG